jgi:hypothetical protein
MGVVADLEASPFADGHEAAVEAVASAFWRAAEAAAQSAAAGGGCSSGGVAGGSSRSSLSAADLAPEQQEAGAGADEEDASRPLPFFSPDEPALAAGGNGLLAWAGAHLPSLVSLRLRGGGGGNGGAPCSRAALAALRARLGPGLGAIAVQRNPHLVGCDASAPGLCADGCSHLDAPRCPNEDCAKRQRGAAAAGGLPSPSSCCGHGSAAALLRADNAAWQAALAAAPALA